MTTQVGVSALKTVHIHKCVPELFLKVGISKAAPSTIFMQSRAPSGAAEKERKALQPHQLRYQRCALFAQI